MYKCDHLKEVGKIVNINLPIKNFGDIREDCVCDSQPKKNQRKPVSQEQRRGLLPCVLAPRPLTVGHPSAEVKTALPRHPHCLSYSQDTF